MFIVYVDFLLSPHVFHNENQLSDYNKIVEKLGGKGASETAASEIQKFFNT